MRTTLINIILMAFFCQLKAQQSNEPVQVNIIIAANNQIMVEEKPVNLLNLKSATRKIVNREKKYEKLVYKIYADKNLKMAYIMDVEQKLFSWKSAQIQRHLLQLDEKQLDRQNLIENVEEFRIDQSKNSSESELKIKK